MASMNWSLQLLVPTRRAKFVFFISLSTVFCRERTHKEHGRALIIECNRNDIHKCARTYTYTLQTMCGRLSAFDCSLLRPAVKCVWDRSVPGKRVWARVHVWIYVYLATRFVCLMFLLERRKLFLGKDGQHTLWIVIYYFLRRKVVLGEHLSHSWEDSIGQNTYWLENVYNGIILCKWLCGLSRVILHNSCSYKYLKFIRFLNDDFQLGVVSEHWLSHVSNATFFIACQ